MQGVVVPEVNERLMAGGGVGEGETVVGVLQEGGVGHFRAQGGFAGGNDGAAGLDAVRKNGGGLEQDGGGNCALGVFDLEIEAGGLAAAQKGGNGGGIQGQIRVEIAVRAILGPGGLISLS